jgi:hypothetical protein
MYINNGILTMSSTMEDNTTGVNEVVQTTELVEAVISATVAVIEATVDVVEAIETLHVTDTTVETTEVVPNADTTEVVPNADTTEVVPNADTTEVVTTVDTTEVVTTVDTTEVRSNKKEKKVKEPKAPKAPKAKEVAVEADVEEEPEETHEDPVKKFTTFGNLENAKRALVAKEYDEFHNQLKLAPYQFYRVSYNTSSDYDGRPPYVAKNLIGGFVRELEDFRKYFFVVHRCVQPDLSVQHYEYTSLWIANTPSVSDVYESKHPDRYADFTFEQIDESGVEQFLVDFRKTPDDNENVLAEKYLQ